MDVISNTQRINVKIATCQPVPNFLCYVSARYYLNWLTVRKVTTKIKKGELFIET